MSNFLCSIERCAVSSSTGGLVGSRALSAQQVLLKKGKKNYLLIRENFIFHKTRLFKGLGTQEFNKTTQNKNCAAAHLPRGNIYTHQDARRASLNNLGTITNSRDSTAISLAKIKLVVEVLLYPPYEVFCLHISFTLMCSSLNYK